MGWRTLLVLSAVFPSFLRCELLPIRTYTTADGLAADRVECIVPDSRGFLWFCTPEGLSRFDGYRFVTYGAAEGLPHQVVSTMIETRSGDHLVGTPRGLSRITAGGSGARFTNYTLGPEAAANRIETLRESRSGKIRAATHAGLFEWNDPRDVQRMQIQGLEKRNITDMVETGGSDLWLGTTNGLYLLGDHGIAQSFTENEGLPGDWVEMLLPDSRGRLWVALRGGLALMSRQGKEKWSLERAYTSESGMVGWDVKVLLEASDETLWIGTTMGISRLRLGAGEPAGFQNLTRAQGLSDRAVISLAQDQAGNIWAGTESAGVMRIDRLGFTTYREQDGLPTDRIFSVFQDRSGAVIALALANQARRGKAVEIFDGVRFHTVAPKQFCDHSSWGWNQVLLQSRTGEWWGATNQGLCRYAPVKAAQLDGRKPEACYSSDVIFRIFEDSKGGIWASAQTANRGDQLMRWDPDTNTVVHFPALRSAAEHFDDLVSAFAEDRQGNIWLGSFSGGLYRYNGRTFQYFERKDNVPGGSIYALLANQDGLWIGSNGGGLGRMESPGDERPRIEVYSVTRGMASNIIHCITDDNEGRIYAGTGKGVDRLDPKTGHIRHFSSANGLAHGEFRSALRDRTGALWFATTQGISRLIPGTDRSPVRPRVFVTDLRIGTKAYPLSQLGETRIAQLELQPSQNQVQVEFVGIDYEPGDAIRYSYKLEGTDAGWSPPRSQQTVNFAALAGGTYHFLVKAVTSDGAESAVPAQIDFTVLPPIWKRWWFECLLTAAVAALVFATHRYRMAQMMSLERVRTAIATDLHDDIGASLSQIAILSEVARVGGNGQGRPGEPLERVAELARELVDSMGEIVWSIRSEPHGMDSLIRRMREFALDLLDSQGIEFELRTPEAGDEVQLSLQARRHLFLMFKECIHNAARHSRGMAVMAEMKVADREVVLTVKDNGIGLSAEGKAPGFTGGLGIPSLRKRAESLGGRMELASKPGEGCCVTIHLPTRHGVLAKRG